MKSFFGLLVAMLVTAGMVISTPAAVAQEQQVGVRIQPSIIETQVDPNEVLNYTLRVTNTGTDAATFYLSVKNIADVSETGSPRFADDNEQTGFELSSWVELSQTSITLTSGETGSVPFSIRVPGAVTPGLHVGGIQVASTPPASAGNETVVGITAGCILSLRVSGRVIDEADIRSFSTDKTVYGSPKVNFSVKVQNLGAVLVRPRGPIEITSFSGKKIATLMVNQQGAAIFPRKIREYNETWQPEGFSFGRYQAVASLIYGDSEQKTITSITSFWILPLNVILPAVGVLIFIILASYFTVQVAVKRKLKQMGGEVSPSLAARSRRQTQPISRLALIALTLLFVTLVFLAILFLFLT